MIGVLSDSRPYRDRHLIFLVAANIVVIVCAAVATQGGFVHIDNLQSMANQLPELGLLAIGVMLAMISGNGGIDLSGIALANLCGVTAALVAPQVFDADGSPASYATTFIGIALTTGMLGGVFNGLLIAKVRLTPILATLGTQLIFTGIAVVLTNGSAVRIGYVEPLVALGNETLLGIPIPFLLFLLVVLGLGLALRRTP